MHLTDSFYHWSGQLHQVWSRQFIDCVKAAPLRKEYTRLVGANRGVHLPAIRAFLASDRAVESDPTASNLKFFIQLAQPLLSESSFKTRGLPRDALSVSQNDVDLWHLLICLRDGIFKVPGRLRRIGGGWQWGRGAAWWLISVPELQVLGHFPDASKAGISAKEHLTLLVGKGDDCPQRKHLIRFHRYWNDADHAGALDELVDQARLWPLNVNLNQYVWPTGGDEMQPQQLLAALRQANLNRFMGPDVRYFSAFLLFP